MKARTRTTSTKFVIGASGPRPIGGHNIYIGTGAQYYVGASSSPSHVVITRLTSYAVYYRQSPYETDIYSSLDSFRDLAERGCKTWLASHAKYDTPLVHTIRKVLDGQAPEPVNAEDLQRVFAIIRPTAELPDAWHQFEEQFSELIGGDISAECDGGFEVWCDRGDLSKLPGILAGSSFEYSGFREVNHRYTEDI